MNVLNFFIIPFWQLNADSLFFIKFCILRVLENREKSWKVKSYGKVREISKKLWFLMFFWKIKYNIQY
jgi:hypothetical protein